MRSNLVSFIQILRSRDVRISPAETLDAMDIANTLGFSRRSYLHDGLAMALAKTPAEKAVFSQCFDQYFSQDLLDFSDSESPDKEPDSNAEDSVESAEHSGEDSPTADDILQSAAEDMPPAANSARTPSNAEPDSK